MIKQLVSIIIPAHNSEETISRAVKSCLMQTYQKIEVIIINNGTTDQTKAKIERFADPRIKYFEIKPANRSLARNLGIKESSGEFLQFLDADDYLESSALENSAAFLNDHPDYFAVAGSIMRINELLKTQRIIVPNGFSRQLLDHNLFVINAVLFRNHSVILFDENLSYCEDWLFWADNLLNRKVHIVDEVKGSVYVTGKNTMSNTLLMDVYRVYVRALIHRNYLLKTSTFFLKDLKSILRFLVGIKKTDLSVVEKKKLQCTVKQNLFWAYFFASMIIHLPFMEKVILKRRAHRLKHSEYHLNTK